MEHDQALPAVYVVQHVHVIEVQGQEDQEDVKLIGVYSTEARAWAAVERATRWEGFRDSPEGFSVDCYVLDEDHWAGGFATIRYGVQGRETAS